LNTGLAITRLFEGSDSLDPMATPAVLVAGHAPFTWGPSPVDAAHTAVVLETVARMAILTLSVNPECAGVSKALLDRHYFRKHGPKATYGQS
jgi:L-ribulose-5-phosphate 4-epimerase